MKRMLVTCHTPHDGWRGRPGFGEGRWRGLWATVASAGLRGWVKQSIRERDLKAKSVRGT